MRTRFRVRTEERDSDGRKCLTALLKTLFVGLALLLFRLLIEKKMTCWKEVGRD